MCIRDRVNIVVTAGGVWGYRYIRNLREKQREATFSYLMRLNVRLKYFYDTLVAYQDEIMERFRPRSKRRGSSVENTIFVEDVINRLAENARETLEFLRNENNQLPAQRGWIKKFNRLDVYKRQGQCDCTRCALFLFLILKSQRHRIHADDSCICRAYNKQIIVSIKYQTFK